MKKLFIILALVLFASTASADECAKPKNDFDGVYCLNKNYMETDKKLNESYKKLMAKLDKEGKELLKKGQLLWIEKRNTQCSINDEKGFFVNLECAINITKERTNFLDDRYKECTTGKCMNDKLTE